MHPEADALLDAIFGSPDDDTPRLVYADWLQERGQENYAQFIRLQCAAAREKLWSDEANRLWEEIGRVWARLDEEWWPATREVWRWGEWHEGPLDAIHFERGFLRSTVRVTSELVVRSRACWAWLPSPETVLELSPGNVVLESLASCTTIRRIQRIRCCGSWDGYDPDEDDFPPSDPLDPDSLDIFLRSPYLSGVCELDLSVHWLTQSNLHTLLTTPNLRTVTYLNVSFHPRRLSSRFPESVTDPGAAIRALRERFKHVQYFML